MNATEAITEQKRLRSRLCIKNDFHRLKTVAGVDVSYDAKHNLSRAFIVTMYLDDLIPIESVKAQLPTDFPYIPGLLSFREIPVILKALKMLKDTPDLLMVDGHGIAHPRRMGIAAHLGIITDIPSIGVAKSRLTGQYSSLGPKKGDASPLFDKDERIGTVLRSRDNTLPLFISPGHRVDQETALAITRNCLTRYRLPEPTRIADKLSKQKQAP